jgi:pimeloyl-ACP methyl ester carboxylesterase
MNISVRSIFIVILLGLFALNANAKEVKIKSNGLTLNAYLEMAEGKKLSDGVVLMTHGTLAHGQMEIMVALQELLKEKGINTLSITLALGLDNRHGMYDCAVPHHHKHSDALDEIGLWVNWLKKQGATKITLLGHSRSGNQVPWYVEERGDPSINGLILLAPGSFSGNELREFHKGRYGEDPVDILSKANAMVKSGKGSTVMPNTNFIYCKSTSVSADSFVSYYGSDPHFDTLKMLTRIKQPSIIIVGTEDDVVPGLQEKAATVADGKKITLKIIDGAGHFLRDLHLEDAVDIVVDWLETK